MTADTTNDALEALSRGYHNAINDYWRENFGGRDYPWDKLPERPAKPGLESRELVRSLMTRAIEELRRAGYEIRDTGAMT